MVEVSGIGYVIEEIKNLLIVIIYGIGELILDVVSYGVD